MGARFKKCDNDVQLVHLGHVLIPESEQSFRPMIEVWGSPSQRKNGFRATNFSNMPALYRGYILNKVSLKEHYSHSGNIILTRTDVLAPDNLGVFPELSCFESLSKVESEQYAFVVSGRNGRLLVIPQLELARALFYTSSYLARASLTSTTLRNDFCVDEQMDKGIVNIQVLSTTSYPKTAFSDPATRSMLAWLLVYKQARYSFESIFQHFNNNMERVPGYKKWKFSFNPPDMAGWTIHYSGRLDSSGKYELVEKITQLEIDADMPDHVFFHHPDFKHNDPEKKPTIGSSGESFHEVPENHEIDDENSASNSNRVFQIGEGDLFVKFKKSFSTAKSTAPRRAHRPNNDNDDIQEVSQAVSTDEPGEGGDIPAADIGGGRDENSDKTQQYASRFKAFDLMVDTLIKQHGCLKIEEVTHELPRVGRSKCHEIAEGQPRVIRYVLLMRERRASYLLEVDTTGLTKRLSTRCIKKLHTIDWDNEFSEIKKGVVQKSLSWPVKAMDELFGAENHEGIHHPNAIDKTHPNGIPADSIPDWAVRIASKLS